MKDIYLLLGSESALADRALGKLLAELKAERAEITTLFAGEVSVGEISDALSPSLFSERRALILRDLQDLAEEAKNEITRYLDATDPTLTLVLIHKGGVKGKALLDQIKKAKPEIIACEPLKKESEKEDFVRNLFLDLGRKASPAAVSALVNATGTDLRELSAAVSQLASDSPAGLIEESHVNKYHQGKVETTGFDVADKVMEGNLPESLISLRHAITTGTDPVMITSAIASSLRGIAKVSGINRGQKSFELAGELGMAPWQIDKARRQLNGWNANTLTVAVAAIAKCDAQVKGGASDPIYALEQALTRICAARSGRI
ncbi:MAG: DNA polymerase III subunit delta [Candidatus Nanopelagicaceae bacterium]|nr:DNA polymerase III subunit delta [Candidatus Nanopelagicaceae bacterium]